MIFIVEHHRRKGHSKVTEFADSDAEAARLAFRARELALFREKREEIIFVLQADSVDAVKKTHPIYFQEGGSRDPKLYQAMLDHSLEGLVKS